MCIAADRSWLKHTRSEARIVEIFGDAGARPTLEPHIRHLNLFGSPLQPQLSTKPPRKIAPVSIMSPATTNRMTKPMSIIRESEVFFPSPNFLLFPIA